MANTTIELRQSGSTGNTPSLGVLANGELAINRADGILYYKSASNTLGSIRTTQPAGLTTEVQFNDAGSFGSNSGFTFSKTTGAVSVSGNVSTAAYFLGDGSKLTGLAPALQIYSLANTASGVSDYMVLKSLDAYSVGTQNTTTRTVTTTPTILTSFITDVGFPNISVIPSGDIVVEFDTQKASGAIGYYCYAEIYKRTVGGTETLIATTGNSSTSTLNSQIQQRVNHYVSTPIVLDISDRIVVKIYAVMLSTSASISIYFDGAADGAFTLPTLPASTVNFVPYLNATANVQLNSFSLVANTVTANSIIVLGRDLNAFANAAFDKANSVTQQGFVTVAANGTNVVADANNDTLTLSAANGVGITSNATTDTITINLTPTGVTSGTYGSASIVPVFVVDAQGRLSSVTNTTIAITSSAVSGTFGFGSGGTNATSYTTGTLLVSNGTAIISLANTGTAATYANASHVPVITTDAYGRISAVTNTSIAIAASRITSGVLSVARGGTNQTSYTTGAIVQFDGTSLASLANTGTAGTYGNSTHVPVITTDVYGRVSSVTNTIIQSATTSQNGIVRLDDTITSTSTTLAATANSVNTAYVTSVADALAFAVALG